MPPADRGLALLERWRRAWGELGVRGDDALFHELVACYTEPHRRYHTLRHLEECFDAYDEIRDSAEHPAEIEIALWFHDAIHDPRADDNEVRSADWAEASAARAGLPVDMVARIHALVAATRHREVPDSTDASMVADVDLAILGADEARFDEYEREVREEYAWVPESIFRRGRSRMLEAFLQRPRIYQTRYFSSNLEARARRNLARALDALTAPSPQHERHSMAESIDPAADVRALVFDVFGTVVDWHGSVAREVRDLAKTKGLKINAVKFTKAWRAGYRPAMDRVRSGELPWTKIDVLHRMILDGLLRDFKVADALTEEEKVHLNKVWHRLKPWPDSSRGLKRLKKKYIIATLSNGNTGLLVNMAKNGDLAWDCVFSSETFKHFKPDPEMYLGAADALDLQPGEVMMVASHKHDLRAAAKNGLKTAFIKRPHEYGRNNNPDLSSEEEFTINADSFLDLADRLGA